MLAEHIARFALTLGSIFHFFFLILLGQQACPSLPNSLWLAQWCGFRTILTAKIRNSWYNTEEVTKLQVEKYSAEFSSKFSGLFTAKLHTGSKNEVKKFDILHRKDWSQGKLPALHTFVVGFCFFLFTGATLHHTSWNLVGTVDLRTAVSHDSCFCLSFH